ncbi:MAG: FRG domain-containing protein [Colwellia sp.]|nr:FRG domain-containing protein [Colwellia sp.]
MEIKEYEVNSLSEYITAIEKINEDFSCHSSDVWYRGLADASNQLIPGVKWRDIDEDQHEYMVSEFLTSYVLYEKNELSSGYDLYSLMQHYGLPTNLLDWSLSPLTALYFAMEKANPNYDRVVWVMNPDELNSITLGQNTILWPHDKGHYSTYNLEQYLPTPLRAPEGERPQDLVAIQTQPTNQRVSSQQGGFTVHGTSDVPIDKIFEEAEVDQIAKVVIKGKIATKNIRKSLRTLGIREDTIYQDLSSLVSRIKREYGVKS